MFKILVIPLSKNHLTYIGSYIPVTSVIFFSIPHSLCQWAAWGPSWHLLLTDTAGRRTHRCDWPHSAGCPHSARGTSSDSGRSLCKTCGWRLDTSWLAHQSKSLYVEENDWNNELWSDNTANVYTWSWWQLYHLWGAVLWFVVWCPADAV